MVDCLIQIIKHGITILFATPKNVTYWDEQLAKVMFRYRCGIQTSTKFSLFMIMTGHSPHLKADNYLHSLTIVVDDNVDVETCRNPSFGLVTKAKGLQGCGPRESMGVTSHTPGNVEKCEGMNPHTFKATPTLGDGVQVDF
jgi:hypothetical protein